MPTGTALLLIVAALIYFGAGQRMLDRMRLTDTQALIAIALMIGGSFITLPLKTGRTSVSLNLGGAVVPLALVVYLLVKADTARERTRALVASLITGGIVYGVSQFTDFDPSSPSLLIDPLWLFSVVAGIVGYLSGRSRRASFIAGVLGLFAVDLIHLGQALINNMATRVVLGGAGVFDAMVVAGLIAVALAEIVGETRERIGGDGEEA
ncbi:MAG: DUF1614 domain-containing protein [Bacillota bacterium]|nr:DUF1614 domain-containing protein [Bacillota bacterium]NLJ01879.1 DUF1614 domain-containing protein [Bacillota bacterium]